MLTHILSWHEEILSLSYTHKHSCTVYTHTHTKIVGICGWAWKWRELRNLMPPPHPHYLPSIMHLISGFRKGQGPALISNHCCMWVIDHARQTPIPPQAGGRGQCKYFPCCDTVNSPRPENKDYSSVCDIQVVCQGTGDDAEIVPLVFIYIMTGLYCPLALDCTFPFTLLFCLILYFASLFFWRSIDLLIHSIGSVMLVMGLHMSTTSTMLISAHLTCHRPYIPIFIYGRPTSSCSLSVTASFWPRVIQNGWMFISSICL